jgi:DNA-binding HxlR family transcriptional regulator
MDHVERQYCPVAASAYLLGDYWSLLVVRELLSGGIGFNQLVRQLPGISRSLLMKRLRGLQLGGVVERLAAPRGRQSTYRLTPSGADLQPLIRVLGEWGQRWAVNEPDPRQLDPDVVLWLIRRILSKGQLPERRIVLQVDLPAIGVRLTRWLILERADASLCIDDPGLEVDLFVTADIITLYKICRQQLTVRDAMSCGSMDVHGRSDLTHDFPGWFLPR